MIPYLFNTTVIWLLSLVCFDLFLKRETYHGYNRAYLLLTMIAGIVIPLYARPSFTTTTAAQAPMLRIDQARTAVADRFVPAADTAITQATPALSWATVLQWIYMAGAAVSLLFLLREVFLLIRYYRTGKKTKQGRYTIVETGRSHGPFSVGRILFVSSINDYDAEQWQIVLRHEQQHSRLLHLIDMILIQAVQIVFWFHPLVYLYRRRLLLVHEYQADTAAAIQPVQYGNFLVEQTLLQRGPLTAHSFNRSPVKNRLRMLTKKTSSGLAKARFWLVVPVLLAGLFCCAKGKEKHERKKTGNTIVYKSNTFILNEDKPGSVVNTDPKTGIKDTIQISFTAHPVKMNGKKIYDFREVKEDPELIGGTLEDKLIELVKPELEQLPNADCYVIDIKDLIIDEKGMPVYFDYVDLHRFYGSDEKAPEKPYATPEQKARIIAKLNDFLDAPHRFKPAMADGKAVIFGSCESFPFAVKNHRITHPVPIKF